MLWLVLALSATCGSAYRAVLASCEREIPGYVRLGWAVGCCSVVEIAYHGAPRCQSGHEHLFWNLSSFFTKKKHACSGVPSCSLFGPAFLQTKHGPCEERHLSFRTLPVSGYESAVPALRTLQKECIVL